MATKTERAGAHWPTPAELQQFLKPPAAAPAAAPVASPPPTAPPEPPEGHGASIKTFVARGLRLAVVNLGVLIMPASPAPPAPETAMPETHAVSPAHVPATVPTPKCDLCGCVD